MSEQGDIAETLRVLYATHPICIQAADEIASLRAQLAEARKLPNAWEAKAKLSEHVIYDADMLNECAAELRTTLAPSSDQFRVGADAGGSDVDELANARRAALHWREKAETAKKALEWVLEKHGYQQVADVLASLSDENNNS